MRDPGGLPALVEGADDPASPAYVLAEVPMSVGEAVLLALLALPGEVKEPSGTGRARVRILDVRAVGVEGPLATRVSEVVRGEALNMAGLEVIDRSSADAAPGAGAEEGTPGCPGGAACPDGPGGALGADHLLVASLSRSGSSCRLALRLVDPRSARTEAEFFEWVEAREDALAAAARRLVHRLLDPVAASRVPASASSAQPSAQALLVTPPLVLKGGAEARAETIRVPSPAPRGGFSRRGWSWVSAGAGLGMVAGGLVFGVRAKAAYEAEKRASARGDLAGYESSKSAARSRARVADALFAAGAVGIGVGVYLRVSGGAGERPFLAAAPAPGGFVAAVGAEL
jgi:hypothetical protein